MTPTEQDNELFELCRQVYEATGWGQEPDISYLYKYWDSHDELCVISIEEADDALVPAYTSDYLLERLPFFHEYWNGGNEAGYLTVKHWAVQSEAGYWEENGDRKPDNKFTSGYADTPLEALLKLTLKLHKEIV